MSSTIDWPATLPQSWLVDGFSQRPKDNLIRTEMDAAQAQQRPRFSYPAETIRGSMKMTAAQYVIFKEFFKTDLKNGSLSFNMPTKDDISVTQEVMFTDVYDPDESQYPWVRVSMSLETVI